jgi:hypothetical protein
MVWQVILPDGSVYTGNYKTIMKFIYNKQIVNGKLGFSITLVTADTKYLQSRSFSW